MPHLVTKLYLPPSCIIEPSEGGGPQITQESIGYIGKPDDVIELLCHLPYIRDDDEPETPQVAPGTLFVDWTSLVTKQWDREIALLATDGDDFSFTFDLDRKLGVIYWVKCPRPIKQSQTVEPILDKAADYAPEEELAWRADGSIRAVPHVTR